MTVTINSRTRLKRIPPQTVAIDVEPSDAMTSELTRTVYGKSSSGGKTASRAFSARVPGNSEDTRYHLLPRNILRSLAL